MHYPHGFQHVLKISTISGAFAFKISPTTTISMPSIFKIFFCDDTSHKYVNSNQFPVNILLYVRHLVCIHHAVIIVRKLTLGILLSL